MQVPGLDFSMSRALLVLQRCVFKRCSRGVGGGGERLGDWVKLIIMGFSECIDSNLYFITVHIDPFLESPQLSQRVPGHHKTMRSKLYYEIAQKFGKRVGDIAE